MLGSHGSSSAPRARPLNRQRRLLERYLTTISGAYTAEAYGIIGMKLLTLGLGGLIVWGIGQAHQEGTTEFVLAVLLLGPCVLPVLWIALYTYSGFVIGRLAPSGRFRPVRPAAHRRRRLDAAASAAPEGEGAPDGQEAPGAPGAAGPSRRRSRRWRAAAVALLVLGGPLLVVVPAAVWIDHAHREHPGPAVDLAYERIVALLEVALAPVLVILALSATCLVALLGMLVLPPLWSLARRGIRMLRGRAAQRSARRERGARTLVPPLPAGSLCPSARGQLGVVLRAGLFLLLGIPMLPVLGATVLAYLLDLWSWWVHFPRASFVGWEAPAYLDGPSGWFFDGEHVMLKAVGATISVLALCAGIALARLCVPRLIRRGADAIDLALTPSGVIVRGGLVLGWDEIAEVLVVRDLRIGAAVSRNELEALGGPGITLHPTFVAAHSRIRLALVLHDLGAVADRAVQVAPPRHRSLRADRSGDYGYALCDLWTHAPDVVAEALVPVAAAAATRGIPVTVLERRVERRHPSIAPGWLGVLLTWR
ncbi:hypothetical protein [Brachybacterium paraconglomeratum]|uniref:hypothetical protein n=1 Tax=Brachybacterium paraconglomeratum TaxID=173362 RepID=UPI00351319BC